MKSWGLYFPFFVSSASAGWFCSLGGVELGTSFLSSFDAGASSGTSAGWFCVEELLSGLVRVV